MTMLSPRPQRPGRASLVCLGLALWATGLGVLQADKPAAKTADKKTPKTAADTAPVFIRIVRDPKTNEPLQMETATVRYVKRLPKSKGKGKQRRQVVTVDMIGAVHVGERAYYEALNKQFQQYDALLYELVGAKGTRPPRGAKAASSNPAGFMQNAMKSTLELDHQLELIDYTPDNFVHADLSPADMAKAMKKRGDTPLSITLGVLSDMFRQQAAANAQAQKNGAQTQQVDLTTMLLDPNGPAKMKRMMAEQMVSLGPTTGVGKTLDQLLIQDRNAAAMVVLNEQIKAGRRRLGVFYGAAHLPDFHRRMLELGFQPRTTTWTAAWDLRLKNKSRNDGLIQLLRLLERLNQ